MYTHLYLWKQQKVTDRVDSVLKKCDAYVETLDLLSELIEYPLYSPKETVVNWKELRTEWKREFLERIDRCCFHLIKNLSKNFRQQLDRNNVYKYDFQTNHIKLGMSAWMENSNILPSLKWTPKIIFEALDAEFVMPAAYRQKAFILRLVYLDRDFFSDDTLTSSPPSSLPMEKDLLKEVHRCFEEKKKAKLSVADRELEKVKAAKQKVLEAQEAANQAEKSFKTIQEQTKDLKSMRKSRESVTESDLPILPASERRRKTHWGKESTGKLEVQTSDSSLMIRRGAPMGEVSSTNRLLTLSAGAIKGTLDAISMKSGKRKKLEKVTCKTTPSMQECVEDEDLASVFKSSSMVSTAEIRAHTIIRKDSALCFEESELSDAPDGSLRLKKIESFDSLDLFLGREDEEDLTDNTIPSLRQLLKETVLSEHDAKRSRQASNWTTTSNYSWEGKKKRNRGKSILSMDKKLTGETEDFQPTASEIYEAKEDARQEQYVASLYIQNIPERQHHLNLRMYSIVSGIYMLDLINHVPQPRQLANGTSVQIFYGEMNIKVDDYEYKYIPPSPPGPDDDPEEPVPDQGLQHLLHVKTAVPKNIVYFGQPEVALWDRENGYWTNEHVHKLDIDMKQNKATFSLSRIMPFAFFIKKYSLLPYIGWALKPQQDIGGVTLILETIFASIEFHVLDFDVSLISAVNHEGQNITQADDIIGKKMHLHKLIALMKSRGINVFPDEDTCIYTDNAAKDVVLEEHTNLSIAMWSDTLEFQGCEWNAEFKRRKLAFRVREYLAYNLELRFRTIIASCLSAMIYRLSVEDPFDGSKVENYGFNPDVMNLLDKAFVHVVSSRPLNPRQVLNVYSLLCRTKVFSYYGKSRKETPSSSSEDSRKGPKTRTKKQVRPRNKKTTASSSTDGSSILTSEFSTSITS